MIVLFWLASAAMSQGCCQEAAPEIVVTAPSEPPPDPLASPPPMKPEEPPDRPAPSLAVETPSADPPRLIFDGNLVMNNEVYEAILAIPAGTEITEAVAADAARRLNAFLINAGYELAAVEAVALNGRLLLAIDEGRLDKVILRGQGSLKTVQLKLAVSLPYNVFNRPYLERMLTDAEHTLGVEALSYQLVPTSNVEHFGFQLDDFLNIDTLAGLPVLPPRSAYELHVFLKPRVWNPGLNVTANISGADGLRLGLDYKGERLIFAQDRWRAGFQVGGKSRSRIDDGTGYLALSHAIADVQWLAPAIGTTFIRPTLQLRGDHLTRQRKDLQFENYNYEKGQVAFLLSYQRTARLIASLGVGTEWRRIGGVERVGDATAEEVDKSFKPPKRPQPMILANLEMVFNPDEVRRDRRHQLVFTTRQYPDQLRYGFGVTNLQYQKVWEFGWHDLWLTSKGGWLWGEVPLPEEDPIGGNYVRGVFGDELFAHNALNVGTEFRYSVGRDKYKLGIFHDGVVFGRLPRAGELSNTKLVRGKSKGVTFANSFGAGFHLLLADSFQVDVYYAIGFAQDRDVPAGYRRDTGLAIRFKQAY